MKKLLSLLAFLLPLVASANFAVPWQATSTTQGWVFPGKINGTEQTVVGTNFIGTSTALSYFLGSLGIGTSSDSVNPTQPGKITLDCGTITENCIDSIGNINDFLEHNVMNLNTGANAQSGYAATRNDGTLTTAFTFFGINNTGFNTAAASNIGNQGDGTVLSDANDFWIGQGTAGKKTYFTNGGVSTSSIVMTFANQQVGIGSTSPWGMFSVNHPATGAAIPIFIVASSTATATTTHIIDLNSGNVGIGTSTPMTRFDVATGADNDILFFNTLGYSTLGLTGVTGTAASTNSLTGLVARGSADPNLYVDADSTSGNVVTRTNGATEKMRVTSAGLVGVGTSTPWAQLSVNPAATLGSAPPFSVGSSTLTDLIVASTSYVGVGTAVPVYGRLQITDNGATTALRGLAITQHNTGVQAAVGAFYKSRGTQLAPTTVVNGDYTGAFIFANHDGTNYDTNGTFGFRTNGTVSSNSVPGQLFFAASNASDGDPYTNGNVRMVVGSTGLNGFGVTTPTARLTLANASTLNWDNGANGTGFLGIATSSTNGLRVTNGGSGTRVDTYLGGEMYTATADVTLNSLTPTTAFSGTKVGTTVIPANMLRVGSKFTISGAGNYTTPIGNVSTVTITPSIASSTATNISTVTTGALPSSATNLPYNFLLSCTTRSIGAAATLVCDGTFDYATALSAVAKTSNSLSTVGTITFDSTVAETLDVKVSWSAVTTQTATVQESSIDFWN